MYDTGWMAEALMRHRDGIVGPWKDPKVKLPYELEDVKRLWDWEPWVRATVFDFELITGVHFTASDSGALTLWHMDFGKDKAGKLSSSGTEIVSVICPEEKVFLQQVKKVEEYADLREDRAVEILAQIGPQHAFWSSITNAHPVRTPKTFELLDMANRFSVIVEMRLKHAMAVPRPLEYSPQIQPMILTPGHGSFPSGHSTQAHFVARVLYELLGGGANDAVLKEQLMRQAARVAINRTVAGVHYPVDSAVGRLLGTTLAEYFICRCKKGGKYVPRRFNGKNFDGALDFDPNESLDKNHGHVEVRDSEGAPSSEVLYWLWDRAEREWNGQAR